MTLIVRSPGRSAPTTSGRPPPKTKPKAKRKRSGKASVQKSDAFERTTR